jgi:hypothetical protein
LVWLSRSDADDILSQDKPGPNEDPQKVENLQSFPLPEHFIEPGSDGKKRMVNVFMVIFYPDCACLLVDFVCLVHIHVISRDIPWTPEELKPGSSVSPSPSWFWSINEHYFRLGLCCGRNSTVDLTGIRSVPMH